MSDVVSVVILTYNSGKYAMDAVESILSQTYNSIELLVVDNASKDGTVDMILDRYPDIWVIRNDRNLGFSEGMNRGIAESSGRYVIPMNADAVLDENFIEQGVQLFNDMSKKKIGMLAGLSYKLVNGEKINLVDQAGIFLRKRFSATRKVDISSPGFVFAPPGCFPFLRRDMLEDIALEPGEYYDNSYFCYFEDIALGLRAHLRGWRCFYDPRMVGWHVRSASSDGAIRFYHKPVGIQRKHLRNRYVTMIECLPASLAMRLLPYLMIVEIGLIPYMLIKSPITIKALVLSWFDVLRGIPHILARRRQIQSRNAPYAAQRIKNCFRGY